ncbi:GNAT family N-acetyltransferase [Caryophanon tenue]|uniref:N-acetyltransferase domain-containing protein n=1 Tax=Caryophanon tenue TaxID=33978 RepID=A0A1C0Y7C9_9BACL|nr:GNAT family N-acetyltransferase [Caryophanon tenue]OCS83045.1 hypothetical protein A6M13_06485 [Caryophanon tenue]
MIRPIEMKDAESFLALLKEIDQSNVMRQSPGERNMTVDLQLQLISDIIQNPRAVLFVYEEAQQLIGYSICRAETFVRTKHIAEVTIGVSEKFRRKGIAAALMLQIEQWAATVGIHRLECIVFERNEYAQQYLHKMGFTHEGRRVHALYINGDYYDELCYYKLVTPAQET